MASTASPSRVALVTGANQGIGFFICKLLLQAQPPFRVLVGSRDPTKGAEAVAALRKECPNNEAVEFIELDLNNPSTIASAAETVKNRFGSLAVLVNNAGMAFKGSRFDEEVCRITTETNYFGTRRVTEAFLPLLRSGGTIVNVSSMMGRQAYLGMRQENRQRFLDDQLTLSQLDSLMEEFFVSVGDNSFSQKGWPSSGYGMSKAAMSAYTRILSRDLNNGAIEAAKGITVNAMCPGYCSTSMSSWKGPRPAEQGARTALALVEACLDKDGKITGTFWEDEKQSRWV